jgi:hypothetical protein
MHLYFIIGSMSGSMEMIGEGFIAGKSTLIEI